MEDFEFKKHLGQHFLLDREVIAKWLDAYPLKGKIVLEVGAGTGVVSVAIAMRKPKRLVCLEIDADAADKARGRLTGFKKVEVVPTDVRHVPFEPYEVIVGAIPYYLSSYLVFKALDANKPCLFVVQKEFAKRMVGKPGTSDWGRLSLMAQSRADVSYLFDISRHSFVPQPEVDSAAVLLVPKKKPLGIHAGLATGLFSHKNQSVRKAFIHSASLLGLEKSSAKNVALPFSKKRVRELTMDDWVALSDAFRRSFPG
ncbi:MAG TPA: 16S rRNA (adenine(1518)-N(6)/adenine(1519)-N(6))-dimethyltransferase RsmA [Candidatus Norongarragalinales archaeon]|nr:16S rRNA (adenine(1518)-N(6)/adenine(1519)-N(6))-dimethyltransferase RsmA [Candidatus Norongarragalinales archaeon]